jgi:hypothetical protein
MGEVIQLPVTSSEPDVPEFIRPADLLSMTNEQIDALIDGIRQRRLNAAHIYKETKRHRDKASGRNLLSQFEKRMLKLAKEIEKADKIIDSLEKAANDVRALRLQLGEDPL